jgi:hypothetical protein
MSDQNLDDFAEAFNNMSPEVKARIQGLAGISQQEQEIDTVSIKFELVKFVTELRKHNQGVDWETNKLKPKQITVETIILDANKLVKFILE